MAFTFYNIFIVPWPCGSMMDHPSGYVGGWSTPKRTEKTKLPIAEIKIWTGHFMNGLAYCCSGQV